MVSSNLKKDSKTNVLDKQNKIKKLIDSDASVNNPKLDQNLVKIPKSNTSTEDKNNVQSKDLLNPIEKIDVVSGINDNSPAQVYFGYDIFEKGQELFENSITETLDPNYLIGSGDEIIVML